MQGMKKIYENFAKRVGAVFLMLAFVFAFCNAQAATITNMRIGQQVSSVRIVFDANQKFDYQVFLLSNPKRLVIDALNSNIKKTLQSDKNSLISSTRVGELNKTDKRVVFDLQKPVLIKQAFMLPPSQNNNWRFVVDLVVASERDFNAKVGAKYALSSKNASSASKVATSAKSSNSWFSSDKAVKPKAKQKIVVLDPGHGGKDPGAIGAHGKTYEKNITLAMGKELKTLLEKKGYKVYLTRSTDIFIPLRQRVKIAQKYKADLFMSLHADSARNRNAKGLSVYTLSETASDKEAAALAERENKVDIIGGVDFSENSKEINDILISLSQTDCRNKSSKFAGYVVGEMKKSVKIVDNTHRFAGFAVLKAPDIPSALLEMGYLSNKQEETLLKQSSYRKKLATSAANAIDKYFNDPEVAALY
ncbi:MAG TPA: N-acetylmuramoyl-L-alanine amidase [Alphaproteobacteria bacterium]|nr:N-acetylmuramoyl-L-alanine amidase [Alphaproteobacteria bacterium]